MAILKTGLSGEPVRRLQVKLGVEADGAFGPNTFSWDRERFVRGNNWAKFGKESNGRVMDACATELYKL